jgi:hypothetical protein
MVGGAPLRDVLGTQFISDDATLILTEDHITRHTIPGLEMEELLKPLHERLEDPEYDIEKDIVVVSMHADPQNFQIADILNSKLAGRPNNKRVVFVTVQNNNETATPYLIRAIAALSRDCVSTCRNQHLVMIDGVKVKYANNRLDIGNLFDRVDDSPLNPFYVSKSNTHYNAFLKDVKATLDSILIGKNTDRVTNHYIETMQYIYRALVSQNNVYLEVNGQTLSVLEAESVIRDAVGAVSTTLNKGFVLNGFESLLNHFIIRTSKIGTNNATLHDQRLRSDPLIPFHNSFDQNDYDATRKRAELKDHVAIMFKESLFELLSYTYKQGFDQIKTLIGHRSWDSKGVGIYMDDDLLVRKVSLIKADKSIDPNAIIQPFAGYEALFYRLNELIPSITTLTTVIGPLTDHAKAADEIIPQGAVARL